MKLTAVPNKGSRLYKNLIKEIRETIKRPKSPAKHVGIEIECLSNKNFAEISEGIADAGVGKFCQVKADGSLTATQAGYIYEVEVCVIAPQISISTIVAKVCEALIAMECIVNKTCGLHVHLDMRSRSVNSSYKRLVNKQELLERYVAKYRVNGTYSKRNRCNHLGLILNEHIYQTVYGDRFLAKYAHLESLYNKAAHDSKVGRYLAINPKSIDIHNTIECRLHEGTLDSDKITEWVKLLVKVADGKIV